MRKILIANRAEIACRVIRTARRMGIRTVAVYSNPDRGALHTQRADEAIPLGGSESSESYLSIEKIINACRTSGADFVHPGYGFLSENPEFVDALQRAGIGFIGPSAKTMRLLGDKLSAKALARKAKVPLVPGIEVDFQNEPSAEDSEKAAEFGRKQGYPFIIKAAAGGGGRGMRRVFAADEIPEKLLLASREARSFFGDGRVFVEKFIANARHVEVQIFGDQHGHVTHLFDRDCSMQRRHQKVIEEAPAPGIALTTRQEMWKCAEALARNSAYTGAGTVEFLLDNEGNFYFLEVNSRLQVEHPVTEEITGLDLVELQIRIARGERLQELVATPAVLPPRFAIEARICAETPEQSFRNSTGKLQQLQAGEFKGAAIRVDSGYAPQNLISHHYDSLVAKVISAAPTREAARAGLEAALAGARITGVRSNLGFLLTLLRAPEFREASHHINFAESAIPQPAEVEAAAHRAVALKLLWDTYSSFQATMDIWRRPSLFRLAGGAIITGAYTVNDQPAAVRLESQAPNEFLIRKSSLHPSREASPADEVTGAIRVLGFADRQLHYELGGRAETAEVSRADNGSFWLSFPWGSVELQPVSVRLKERADQHLAHSEELTSPLPGKIVSIKATAGDHVAEGQTLLVIESMKMEHQIKAPLEGKADKILVAAGQSVEAGQLLVKMAYG